MSAIYCLNPQSGNCSFQETRMLAADLSIGKMDITGFTTAPSMFCFLFSGSPASHRCSKRGVFRAALSGAIDIGEGLGRITGTEFP
jgi:hypothetical protein